MIASAVYSRADAKTRPADLNANCLSGGGCRRAIRVKIGGYRYCVSPITNNSNKQKTEATKMIASEIFMHTD